MRTNSQTRRVRYRWSAIGAAAICLAMASAAPAQMSAPSMAQAIAYEKADLWAGKSEPAPLASAYYSTPVSDDPIPAAASEPCAACNGSGAGGCGGGAYYNRCGCSAAMFPWFTGPGACDDWCVGPHWEVAVDGLIMFRENTDFAAVPLNGFGLDVVDQFDFGPGARVFVTGYNDNDFGLQVGYEGINDFHANALYFNGADRRSVAYESNFNSLEVNFVRRTDLPWRPFAGVRYLELDESVIDVTMLDIPVPAPADPPAGPAAFVDTSVARFLDNRLIGLQGGLFRDVWRLNRWVTIEPFGNAGVYLNDLRRQDVSRTTTTIVNGDDISTPDNEFSQSVSVAGTGTKLEFADLAFVGEAGVTGVVRLTPCVALRGGYQVLAVNGIGQGIDALLAPGFDQSTLVYHGGHFGVEYVR